MMLFTLFCRTGGSILFHMKMNECTKIKQAYRVETRKWLRSYDWNVFSVHSAITVTVNIVNFFHCTKPAAGQDLLIIEASRSHSDTPQSVGILRMSDQPDAETTWNTHKRQTSTPPAGIEPTNPANDGRKATPRGHWDRPVPIVPCIRVFKILSKDIADVIVMSPDIQQKPKFIF